MAPMVLKWTATGDVVRTVGVHEKWVRVDVASAVDLMIHAGARESMELQDRESGHS